jgi:hypothetical protein
VETCFAGAGFGGVLELEYALELRLHQARAGGLDGGDVGLGAGLADIAHDLDLVFSLDCSQV